MTLAPKKIGRLNGFGSIWSPDWKAWTGTWSALKLDTFFCCFKLLLPKSHCIVCSRLFVSASVSRLTSWCPCLTLCLLSEYGLSVVAWYEYCLKIHTTHPETQYGLLRYVLAFCAETDGSRLRDKVHERCRKGRAEPNKQNGSKKNSQNSDPFWTAVLTTIWEEGSFFCCYCPI